MAKVRTSFVVTLALSVAISLPLFTSAQPDASPPGGTVNAEFDTVTVGPGLFNFVVQPGGGSNTEFSTSGNLLFNLNGGIGTVFLQSGGPNSVAMNAYGIWSPNTNLLLDDNVDISGATTIGGNFQISQNGNIYDFDSDVTINDNLRVYGSAAIGSADSSATGSYAVSMGRGSQASGYMSFAVGNYNYTTGSSSMAIGSNNTASQYYAMGIGVLNQATGYGAIAIGKSNVVSATEALAIGNGLNSNSYYEVAVGRYNYNLSGTNTWVGTEPIFVIGNGSSSSARSNAMTVLKNGNVGIGYLNPQARLVIYGGSDAQGGSTYSSNPGYLVLGSIYGANLALDDNEIMARSGSSTATLYLNHQGGAVYASGSLAHGSDRRLKKDIEPLQYGLDDVLKLNPVSFNWKNQENKKKSIGLIAQEVDPIVPELIFDEEPENPEEESTLGIYYSEITPILVNAIKELKSEKDEEIVSLKEEVAALKKVVCELKPDTDVCNN